jgi:hypothetical protein
MRKNIITGVSLVALSAGMAQAGGFELQTLDTSIMYADGNQASISYASIDASIEGVNPLAGASSKKQVVKDQTVTNFSGKFDISESLSFGIHTYRSGAIQLSGGNEAPALANGFAGGNIAPTGDVDLDSTALMVNYALTDNVSVLGGVTQNNLKDGNVTTLAGSYDIVGKSEMGYVVGAAYSVPEIALRAELLYQPKATISTTVTYGGAFPGTAELSLPDTYALSFQTGIAADTLLLASYRKANWGKAQIAVKVPANALLNIDTSFKDSEAYSVGIGRRFSDALSGSITYSKEQGTSATSTSLFSVSNGSDAISIGLQYKRDNMTISGGISQRNVGDMTVNATVAANTVRQMQYTGNSVTAMGLKIAFAF